MTCGQVQLKDSTIPIDVQRGMTLLSCKGEELGKLAAVLSSQVENLPLYSSKCP